MIAELHCHSTCVKLSYFPLFYDAVQTVEEILEQCLTKNIGILSITEHDSLDGYWIAKKIIDERKLPIILVPGCEVSSRDGHILAYGIFKEIPEGLSARETVEKIHQQGGMAVAAHPFAWFYSLKNKVYDLKIDAIETRCAVATKGNNKMAVLAAKKMGIPGTCSSDAHSAHGIGKGKTIFTGKIKTWQDVLEAIKKNEFRTSIEHQSWLRMLWDNIATNIRILCFG